MKARPPMTRGKKWLFKLESMEDGSQKLRGMNSDLKRMLLEQDVMRANGIKPPTVYIDVLKDEVREFKKARTPGKTRVISTCPIQYQIAFKRYFGDFMAAYKRHRIIAEHGIGLNVDSGEWTRVAKYLQQKGGHIVAGDYSRFGYTLDSDVLWKTFQIIIDWYAKYSKSPTLERDQIVRGVLAHEGINVTRLVRNLIYDAPCGIASGFPTTDISNSLVNCMYMRMAWMEITGRSLHEFDQHVNLLAYGDDIAENVSDEYIDIFNTETLQQFFAKYNIVFTDISKTGELIKSRTLDNTPFLKRGFRINPVRSGVYLAPIDLGSIANCLNWVHKNDDPREAAVTNCRAALNLAFGHGPEFYNSLARKIRDSLQKHNIPFANATWHELENDIFSGTTN